MTHHSIAALVVMWELMMIAMMAPIVWRWVALFSKLSGGGALAFSAGYASAWVPFSAGAGWLQHTFQHSTWLSADLALARPLAGAVLVGAGAFQFAPIKRACLRHCRNPLTYFLTRWRSGPPSGFRVGAIHGAYCVGCCWALMATMFAVGAMNAAWMAVLAAIGSIEQIAPRGERIAKAAGIALIAYGVWALRS